MNSKDVLLSNLRLTQKMVLGLAEDMADCCLTFPTPVGGNHALWVLGHLARAEGSLIHEWAMGQDHPLDKWVGIFGNNTVPVADADKYPPFPEVFDACRRIREHTIEMLKSLTEDDLDQPSTAVPDEYHEFFETRRDCFNMTAVHWLEHKGQLADARRAAGLPVKFS